MCASEQMVSSKRRIIRIYFHKTMKRHTMKITIASSCFVLAAVLAPAAALAGDSDSDRAHPLTFVADSIITTKVKAKLADEHMASLAHIGVDTDAKGAVVLSGTARSENDADKAVSIARGTEGVTSVTSTIKVKKDD
jgi:hyperosmotically inducible protein